jgi:hypothetical protein
VRPVPLCAFVPLGAHVLVLTAAAPLDLSGG